MKFLTNVDNGTMIFTDSRLGLFFPRDLFVRYSLNADTLVNSAESFKDEETGVFYEVVQTCNQKEIIGQHLKYSIVLSTQHLENHTKI